MLRVVPRAVNVDERRGELAAAAARVIATHGLMGATMREVAAEAGLTTGALTHYFADKRDLLRFTLEVSLEQRRERAPAAVGEPADRVLAALERGLPVDDDTRLHWVVTMAFCSQAAGDDELAALQRDAYRDFRSRIAAIVRPATGAGGAAADALAERLIAALDGIAVQALFDAASWPPDKQRRVLASTVADLLSVACSRRTAHRS
jgi:AcrR family transcriptional regulator